MKKKLINYMGLLGVVSLVSYNSGICHVPVAVVVGKSLRFPECNPLDFLYFYAKLLLPL